MINRVIPHANLLTRVRINLVELAYACIVLMMIAVIDENTAKKQAMLARAQHANPQTRSMKTEPEFVNERDKTVFSMYRPWLFLWRVLGKSDGKFLLSYKL